MNQIIEPRGPAPASAPSRFDIPIILAKSAVPGRGPKVEVQHTRQRSAVFNDDDHAAADQATCRWVAEVLHAHYRGHFWAVAVDHRQGVCFITIPLLLGNWKFIVPIKLLTPAMVITAGGEILERFKLPRSGLELGSFLESRKLSVSRHNERPPGS